MKKIIFVLEQSSFFLSAVLDSGSVAESRFFDSISYVMLPLLRMTRRLQEDKVNFKLALVFSPIYCDMLSNKVLLERYRGDLEKKIDFTKLEKKRLKGDDKQLEVLKQTKAFFKETLKDFDCLNGELLKEIGKLEKCGFIEILGSVASALFLPIYQNLPYVINSQLDIGKLNFSNYFPYSKIKGFAPPFLGFFNGFDNNLRTFGYEYSLVAGSSFLLSKKVPRTGVFAPAKTSNGFNLLSTDTNTYYDLVFSKNAYQKNGVYLSNRSDIGFVLEDKEHLLHLFDVDAGRRLTGFRYLNKEGNVYSLEKAITKAKQDAHSFVEMRFNILKEVQDKATLKEPFSLMVMPSHVLGLKWAEGFIWLEEVFRKIAEMDYIETVFPKDTIHSSRSFDTVEPFYSSLLDSNYAEELFNKENDWIYRYVMKASERLHLMVKAFDTPTSLNIRTLKQATREVILMQSAYWALLLNNKFYKDHAKKHFIESVKSFTYIYETLGAGMEETKLLTRREAELEILKEVEYDSFL